MARAQLKAVDECVLAVLESLDVDCGDSFLADFLDFLERLVDVRTGLRATFVDSRMVRSQHNSRRDAGCGGPSSDLVHAQVERLLQDFLMKVPGGGDTMGEALCQVKSAVSLRLCSALTWTDRACGCQDTKSRSAAWCLLKALVEGCLQSI